jgi:plasmid stability protein
MIAANTAPPAVAAQIGAILAPSRYRGDMPSVQIKNVPEETHRVLRQRAATAHQSLQEYLRSKLIADASQPTVADARLARAPGIRCDIEVLR